MLERPRAGGEPAKWIAAFALISLAVLAIGYAYYRAEASRIQNEKCKDVAAIAHLKLGQIVEWRKQRLRDVRRAIEDPFMRDAVAEWRKNGRENIVEERLKKALRLFARTGPYAEAFLADFEDGRILLSSLSTPQSLQPCYDVAHELSDEAGGPQCRLTDFFLGLNGAILLDAVGAIPTPEGEPSSILVLRTDAREFLQPFVQSWPTPSQTGETLLVRREDHGVLFLNELRHQHNSVLSLRIPFSRVDLPAVQAVQGRTGIFRGRDYRGVDVIADLNPVPDSSWFMVAKIDAAEALSAASDQAIGVIIIAALFILLAAIATAYGYRRRQAAMYMAFHELESKEWEIREEFRTTLYSIGDAVITTDDAGLVQVMNPVAERLTGWMEQEAQGNPLDEVFKIINEETRNTLETPVNRIVQEGVVVGLANHTLLIARDGVERPIADSGAPIRDEEGNVTGVVLVFRDQTEDRQARKAVEISEKRLQRAEIVSKSGNWEFHLETGVVYASEGARIVYGLPHKEWTIPQVQAIPLPEHRAELDAALRNVIERGAPYDVRFKIRRPDTGEIRHIHSVAEYDKERRLVFGIIQDVTDLVQAEELLRTLSTAIEQNPVSVIITDREGRIEYVNRKCTHAMACTAEEIKGRLLEEMQPGIAYSEENGKIRESIQKGRQWQGEVQGIRKNGEQFWEKVAVSPMRDASGKIVRFLLSREDVTDLKKMENQFQQAQKMEAVGRLAGGVAHDFNNMLGVILGRTELALSSIDEDSPLHGDLQEIHKAAERSASLVRQLLAFARRQTANPRVLDLNEVLAGMIKMLRRLIGEDIDLAWLPGREVWPVKIDPAQLDQILANLVVNARDAISGGGNITIETDNASFGDAYCAEHEGFLSGDYARLTVTDSGCGIEAGVFDRIFEPFFTTKETGRGTGLGLATVYGIVRQNLGFINVYSEPGCGSTFKIYLPRFASGPVEAAPESLELTARGGSETLLVVEDEPSILQLARTMLEQLGYTVLTAATPAEALRTVSSYAGHIHLLITDVVMPEMNGRDLAIHVEALRPGLKLLFMSGYTENAIAHHGVLDEGVRFVPKPFSYAELSMKVREALEE